MERTLVSYFGVVCMSWIFQRKYLEIFYLWRRQCSISLISHNSGTTKKSPFEINVLKVSVDIKVLQHEIATYSAIWRSTREIMNVQVLLLERRLARHVPCCSTFKNHIFWVVPLLSDMYWQVKRTVITFRQGSEMYNVVCGVLL